LTLEVRRVHAENYGVYGARKIWAQLNREDIAIGRDRVGQARRS
jgi:putative transposase